MGRDRDREREHRDKWKNNNKHHHRDRDDRRDRHRNNDDRNRHNNNNNSRDNRGRNERHDRSRDYDRNNSNNSRGNNNSSSSYNNQVGGGLNPTNFQMNMNMQFQQQQQAFFIQNQASMNMGMAMNMSMGLPGMGMMGMGMHPNMAPNPYAFNLPMPVLPRFDQQQQQFQSRMSNNYHNRRSNETTEVTFQLDTNPEETKNSSSNNTTTTARYYQDFYRDHILGASEEHIKTIAKFHSRFKSSCQLPMGIDEEGNPVDAKEELKNYNPNISSSSNNNQSLNESTNSESDYISCPSVSNTNREEDGNDIKKSNLQEKNEFYNSKLRKDSKDVQLWLEFIQFQDKFFQENQNANSNEAEMKKRMKGNKKALIEKKISIIDKALMTNPKNYELNILRMELLNEIEKPKNVLTEYRKLVTTYQQIPSFWLEYVKFSFTQLQIFSTSNFIDTLTKSFQKFKLMLDKSYPEFQRPNKFVLLISDLLFGLGTTLKNAGFSEKALAIQQAQLEMDFYFPEDLNAANEKKIQDLFVLYWDAFTTRFGEPDSIGWENALKDESFINNKKITSFTVSDTKISDFQDDLFLSLNKKIQKSNNWLTVESLRSKLYWASWRPSISDQEDCDDNQRNVLSSDVLPFITRIPNEANYLTNFERQSSYFRHVVNYLLLLQEEFLPRTQTLDTLLSFFSSTYISEPKNLFSEIYFWKKFLNFYHTGDSKISELIPEGFKLIDFMGCSLPHESQDTITLQNYAENVENEKGELLKENYQKNLEMMKRVVEQSLPHLDDKFAILLVQIYFRFQQRNTYIQGNNQEYKNLIKSAKNLVKNEKLRNATELYGEIALLEYFCGKKEKAEELLIKTINSSNKVVADLVIKDSDFSEINLGEHWETTTEIIKIYRTLAEFYIREDEKMAKNVLISLGLGFQSIEKDPEEIEKRINPKNILRARRFFEKVLDKLFENEDSILSNFGGDSCIEFLLQKPNLIVELTTIFAMFQFLTVDFDSSKQIFSKVLNLLSFNNANNLNINTIYNYKVVNQSFLREQIHTACCKLGALSLGKNPMQNSAFRSILAEALQEFPSSPPLLLLFTDVENQCSIVGRLWRILINEVKQENQNHSNHWTPLFMALVLSRKIEELERDTLVGNDDWGIGGPAIAPDTIFYKLDSLLSAAEEDSSTRNCPLIWRIHLKFLAQRMINEGKDEKKAHFTLFEAIRHCPSSKSLYLDGIAYFPDKMNQIFQLLSEKEINIRLPLEELDLLEGNEEEKEKMDTKEDDDIISEEEIDEESDEIQILEVKNKKSKKKGLKLKKKKSKKVPSSPKIMSEGEISSDDD